jgi:hypothetical protein
MNQSRAASDHVTPYDRLAIPEAMLVGLLAAPAAHEGLVEYFGPKLHAELAALARAVQRKDPGPRAQRVYVLPGIMGSLLGLTRGDGRPDDLLWLDPIDIQQGRLRELVLDDASRVKPLGAIAYSYLKLTLSLRKAGFDAVMLDYDWRRGIAGLGAILAERIAADAPEGAAIVAHSMGGLVARAALLHKAAGERIAQLVMLGTPNYGSYAAVQALRGTYSVVRKIGMMDLKHSAEELAESVFATFDGLHEMLPARQDADEPQVFDVNAWPAAGLRPDAGRLERAAAIHKNLAPADARFTIIAGCGRLTPTGVALRNDEFEYEYSPRGDGIVACELARLPGARHFFVDCLHSDLPLARRVIDGTIDILRTGTTQLFASHAPQTLAARAHVTDSELREQFEGKVDWPHMTPEARRLFLDTLNQTPKARPEPKPQRPSRKPLRVRVVVADIARSEATLAAVAVLRGVPAAGAAATVDKETGGVLSDWLRHRIVSGEAGAVTALPRGRRKGASSRSTFLVVGLGRFDRLGVDVIELTAENLARFAAQSNARSLATVAWGSGSGLAPADAFAAQLRGYVRVRSGGNADLARVDLHVLSAAVAQSVHDRVSELAASLPVAHLKLEPLSVRRPRRGARVAARRKNVPRTAPLIVTAEVSRDERIHWRSALLTGGTSAAIYSHTQPFRQAALAKLLDEFQARGLTTSRVARLGARLGQLLLHASLREALSAARRDTLAVVHDAASSVVPWETLNIDGWFPALEHGLSRRYATGDLGPARFDAGRTTARELAVLVIANPTQDLPGAELERQRIAAVFANTRTVRLTEVAAGEATVARVSEEIESGRHDVIHYAGHAFFDAGHPDEGGLMLADGNLSGTTLNALRRLPPLVVFNACESARVRGDPTAITTLRQGAMRTNVSLAETLLRAGVAHYLGTHWPVSDSAALEFSGTFYRELVRGATLGGALVKARRAVHELGSPDWADYIHYGDAGFALKQLK